MEIEIFVNNPWQENTIVLFDETGEAVIVDCGCFGDEEEGQLKDFLAGKKLKPVALLDTHLHIDHIFGNNFVKKTFGLEAWAGLEDNYLIERAVEYASLLGITGITPPPAVGRFLKDGEVVRFGNSELNVIAVPGHSPGSLCFYNEVDKILFAGDVLFAGSVGRSDLPGGNGRLLIEGIKNKLLCLPDDVRVIPGHGPETTIGRERKHNPFLK